MNWDEFFKLWLTEGGIAIGEFIVLVCLLAAFIRYLTPKEKE